jgi:hypothetical protein
MGIEDCILTVYVDKQESSGTVSMFSLPAAHSSWPKAPCTCNMFGKGSLHSNRSGGDPEAARHRPEQSVRLFSPHHELLASRCCHLLRILYTRCA